jgi:hypothetical protein
MNHARWLRKIRLVGLPPLCIVGIAVTACASNRGAPAHLPGDVERFIDRRESCEHFMSEEPYDAARAAFLERQARRYCAGSDVELATLKEEYASDPRVTSRLDGFDPDIEP